MKFEQIHSVQDFLQFESILDSGIIRMKDSSYILIIDVKPINYSLRSKLEKSNILNSYKILFQNFNCDLQILIQTEKENYNEHISKVKKLDLYPKLTEKYVQFINSMGDNSKSSTKNFYIIIKSTSIEEIENNYLKIKEHLLRCGNIVSKLTEEKIKIVLKSFFKEKGW